MKIISALLLFTITSCNLGHGPFRNDVSFQAQVEDCMPYSEFQSAPNLALVQDVCVQDHNLLSFATVEFRDNGTYWNKKQLDNVIKEIERISLAQMQGKNDGKMPSRGEAILLVLYVHGWRHNASENSSDLRNFRSFAYDLAASPLVCTESGLGDTCPHERKPHVLAVYLGWRGDPTGVAAGSLSDSPLRHLFKLAQLPTFWNRKRAAREVAGVAMTEAIFSTLACIDTADRWRNSSNRIAIDQNQTPCNPGQRDEQSIVPAKSREVDDSGGSAKQSTDSIYFSKSRKVLIGHSFGARVLELAVAQAYLGDRARSLQLYREQFGEGGRVVRELEELQTEKTEVENAEEDARTSIEAQKKKRSKIYSTVMDLKRHAKDLERKRDVHLTKRSKFIGELQNLSYGDVDPGSTLRPCVEYDNDIAERCANEPGAAPSTGRILFGCIADQMQCLYDTRICGIQAAVLELEGRTGSPVTLACDLENDRRPVVCQSAYGEHTVPQILSTFEEAFEDGQTNWTRFEAVRKDWEALYCSLRHRASASGHIAHYQDIEPERAVLEDGEEARARTLLEEENSVVDRILGVLLAWLPLSPRYTSTEEVEEELSEQIERAKEHLA